MKLTATKNKNIDCFLASIPTFRPEYPLSGLPTLKAICEQNSLQVETYDYNIHLFYKLDDISKIDWLQAKVQDPFQIEGFADYVYSNLDALLEEWTQIALKNNPRWIGFSIFSFRSEWFGLKICEYIKKKYPQQKIMIGGAFAARIGQQWLDKKIIDIYVSGDGDEAILEILNNKFNHPNINSTAATQVKDLDALPVPDYSDYDISLYEKYSKLRKLSLMTSRGCVRKCRFCNVQELWKLYRYRNGELIAKDLEWLQARHDVNHITLSDNLINGAPKNLQLLADSLIELQKYNNNLKKLKFGGLWTVRKKKLNSENFFAKLSQAGLTDICVGVESGSANVREAMGKFYDNEDIFYLIEMCQKYNIKVSPILMVGYLNEQESDFQMTLDFLNEIKDRGLGYTISEARLSGAMDILKGSYIHQHLEELNVLNYNGIRSEWETILPDNSRNTLKVRMDRLQRLENHIHKLELGFKYSQKDYIDSINKKLAQATLTEDPRRSNNYH